MFNPFVASGPSYFSAFAPNTQGYSLNVTAPIQIGDTTVQGRALAQHLTELTPNGFGQLAYGPGFASGTKLKLDKFEGGVQFGVPVFGQKLSNTMVPATGHKPPDCLSSQTVGQKLHPRRLWILRRHYIFTNMRRSIGYRFWSFWSAARLYRNPTKASGVTADACSCKVMD